MITCKNGQKRNSGHLRIVLTRPRSVSVVLTYPHLLSGIQYVATGLDKLEDDIEKRFASLSSSISDYQERLDEATREWQDDFGSSISIP